MNGAIPIFSVYEFMAWKGIPLPVPFAVIFRSLFRQKEFLQIQDILHSAIHYNGVHPEARVPSLVCRARQV